jgi:hypothetical protein
LLIITGLVIELAREMPQNDHRRMKKSQAVIPISSKLAFRFFSPLRKKKMTWEMRHGQGGSTSLNLFAPGSARDANRGYGPNARSRNRASQCKPQISRRLKSSICDDKLYDAMLELFNHIQSLLRREMKRLAIRLEALAPARTLSRK